MPDLAPVNGDDEKSQEARDLARGNVDAATSPSEGDLDPAKVEAGRVTTTMNSRKPPGMQSQANAGAVSVR